MKIMSCLAVVAALVFSAVPETASAKAVLVAAVDISSQMMTVTRNGVVVDRWRVSTAGPGYRTPTGR